MVMSQVHGAAGAASRRWPVAIAVGALLLGVAGSLEAQNPAPASQKPYAQKLYMMPSVTLGKYVTEGASEVRSWEVGAGSIAGDRERIFDSIRGALTQYRDFENHVGKMYPENQVEWILITDSVADTLADALRSVLLKYQEANEKEILTQGRQFYELAMMNIVGPPTRMLGFHVVLLANFAYSKADSLLAGRTQDRDGVMDGVLRSISDWGALYEQVHDNPLSVYESRLSEEDWIISRLRDKCGTNAWKLTNQYMALVGVDSTQTPPVERFAHEFHLESTKCDDKRVIYVDLPNFQEMQLYVLDQQQKKHAEEASPSP
jgi:hypothetical protein